MRKFIIKESKLYIEYSWRSCSPFCLFLLWLPVNIIQETWESQGLMIQFQMHNLPSDFVCLFFLLCEWGWQLLPPKNDKSGRPAYYSLRVWLSENISGRMKPFPFSCTFCSAILKTKVPEVSIETHHNVPSPVSFWKCDLTLPSPFPIFSVKCKHSCKWSYCKKGLDSFLLHGHMLYLCPLLMHFSEAGAQNPDSITLPKSDTLSSESHYVLIFGNALLIWNLTF